MKNITLSADEGLIEEARRIAAAKNTTLNAEFRLWLADKEVLKLVDDAYINH